MKVTIDEGSNQNKTVVVGMSGGVDSSVVALLLKKQGYNVIGLHMKTENPETAEADEKTVRKLCENLDIECVVVDYKNEMQAVKDYFIKEYLAGRTPNPCVVCNRDVKFSPFVEFAEKLNADYYATGHYAKIEHAKNGHILKMAVDEQKDQSYFLCQLSQKQLSKALFPLGELTKTEVRKIAEDSGLITANKKDSQDICFLGSEKFKDFMQKNYPEQQGNLIDINSNKIVGKHNGISKYTIGQRKGLGIGGGYGDSGDCWFVVNKDLSKNIVYVAQGNDDVLYSKALISNNFNWVPSYPQEKSFECIAKFRYRQQPQRVIVEIQEDNKIKVICKTPQRAITLGQYVVLYNNDICLGGGTIDEIIR